MIKIPIEPQNIKIGDTIEGIQRKSVKFDPFVVKEITIGTSCSSCDVRKPCGYYIFWRKEVGGDKVGRCAHNTQFFLLVEATNINSVIEI